MVDASVQTEKLTVDEFMRLYETEGPFEILDGERIDQVSTGAKHGVIARTLWRALDRFIESHALGELFHEQAFILPDPENKNWVGGSRIPDLMFVNSARYAAYWDEYGEQENPPMALIPDLVVEIVSPTDIHEDVDRKVDLSLEDGVQQVWVIKPKTQTVTVYEGSQRRNLTKDHTLTGSDILPGFEIPVASLFEEIKS